MLKGYLLMETDRNYVKIAQTMIDPQADGQDLQQFMSDSPWQTQGVFEQVRQDIGEKLKLGGGMLNFIEHPILALWRSQRYFVERTIQDTKSELGWDELQAVKYRAYMHTLALCAMALVFMADIKIDQRKDYTKPIIVKEKLNLPQLPDLSLANVKELLKSIFPLPQLSKEQAVQKVINTLFKRAKATQSKYKINSS